MRVLTLIAVVLAVPTLAAQRLPDLAVVHAMTTGDRSLVDVRVWRRVEVNDGLDLVLAVGAPALHRFEVPPEQEVYLVGRKIGLFLQERGNPGRVYTLTIESDVAECGFARILRMTATDTVLICEEEKSEVRSNQKFVYDIRAKRLVRYFSYPRYGPVRVHRDRSTRMRFAATTERHDVIIEKPPGDAPFRVLHRTRVPPRIDPASVGLAPPPIRYLSPPFGPSGAFRLAEVQRDAVDDCHSWTDLVVIEATGPPRRYPALRQQPHRCEEIQWQVDAGTLWYAKKFYSGEGSSGTGGFGYFDTTDRRFTALPVPEVVDWATSALLVRPDAVWMALARYGEWAAASGGVLRYDRESKAVVRFDIGGAVGTEFAAAGDTVMLASDIGVHVFGRAAVRTYFIDETSDGRLRVAEATP